MKRKESNNKVFTGSFMNGNQRVKVTHTFNGNDKIKNAADVVLENKRTDYK